MQLQLACVALQCAHLDYAGLLEEVQSEHVVANVARVLNLTRQRVHDVDQVVALGEYFVNFFTALRKLGPRCMTDGILNDLWMWLVAYPEHVLACDHIVET